MPKTTIKALLSVVAVCFWTACQPPQNLNAQRSVTEEFSQRALAPVDVLFVIDNSESMGQEQEALAASFDSFIDAFVEQAVDYQIGVLSTDVLDGGRLFSPSDQPIIDSNTDQPEKVFAQNVRRGTSGSRVERGIESMAMALGLFGNGPAAENFVRNDAALFVIVVSDDDDQSYGPVGAYARELLRLKGVGNDGFISVSAVAGPVDSDRPGCRGSGVSAKPGYRYRELVDATGGIFTSICEPFAEVLSQLGFAAVGLQTRFPLASAPKIGAVLQACGADNMKDGLCVLVDGQPVLDAWTFDQQTREVVFSPAAVPPSGSDIVVHYFPAASIGGLP